MNICPICNKPAGFKKNRTKKTFCSYACSAASKKNGAIVFCKICSKTFYTTPSQNQIFCSIKCKGLGTEKRKFKTGKYLKCPQCHKQVYVCNSTLKLNKHGIRFCSKKCRGDAMKERKVSWGFERNGKIKISNPYIRKQINNIRMSEHRRIMQEYIGRKLERCEHVHHINGNPLDNRIENLKLVSPVEHGKIHKIRNHNDIQVNNLQT